MMWGQGYGNILGKKAKSEALCVFSRARNRIRTSTMVESDGKRVHRNSQRRPDGVA